MVIPATESLGEQVARRIQSERLALSARWLARLKTLLPVETNDVFPSDQLLDHVPDLIQQIGESVRKPNGCEIAASTGMIDKARELGELRHEQRASVHQVLREYEILEGILEVFIAEETKRLGEEPTSAECFNVLRCLTRAIHTLMRTTVDTFISRDTDTREQQTRRLSDFNRMVSHELRTPVSTLMFAADLLTKDEVVSDPRYRSQLIASISRNGQRLIGLIEGLRRLADVEHANDAPSLQLIELADIAEEVARQLRDMAQARGVDVRVDPKLPRLLVDVSRLELILVNLVSNAIKYSDPAKGSRYVEIVALAGDADHVRIRVRDNGLGIPDEAKDAVFDRFFRAHADKDRELGVDGTGLGLAIVLECVKALDGTIALDSRLGEGTSFDLTLPTPSA